ncbi:MAG: hypothetical protein ABI488_10145 [Polyangiaceae bacterium]
MTCGNRWLCGLLLAGLLAACETDHAALQKKQDSAGGAGGAGGAGAGGTAGSPAPIMGGADGQAGGHADDEPPGSNVLTLLNGVVDAPSVVLCLAKVSAAGDSVPFGAPLTEKPFVYGDNIVLKSVPGAAFDTDTLQPFIIAGELDLVLGLTCEDAVKRAQDEEVAAIDANARAADTAQAGANDGVTDAGAVGVSSGGSAAGGSSAGGAPGNGASGGASPVEVPPRLRLRQLPAIPAGTLSAGRSILYVATGCMGGFAYYAPSSAEYCGDGYTEQTPTVSAMLVSLSRRTQPGEAGMQFLNASLASPGVNVNSRPPVPAQDTGISLVSNVSAGQLAPHSAILSHPASEFGATRLYDVAILAGGAVLTAEPWTDVLLRGGVKGLTDGVTYALVLVGPRADHTSATTLWNPSAITVIPVEAP